MIEHPGDKTFYAWETIEPFRIVVTDPDGDTMEVHVQNLPPGLTWSRETGIVSGTMGDPFVGVHLSEWEVAVEAYDGYNYPTYLYFDIRSVLPPQKGPPVIEHPGDRTFYEEETIRPFRIVVTDPDGDDVTVNLDGDGLPPGLTYSPESGMVSGAPAPGTAPHTYSVSVRADDGKPNHNHFLVRLEFSILVLRRE